MAHIQTHFDHHQREFYLNRRRFRIALAVLFVGLFVVVGIQYQASNASSLTLVKGRVYDSLGNGLANVKLNICHNSTTVVTNSNGYWSVGVPAKDGFCVRYMGGVPAGYGVPLPQNNRRSGETGYENQIAGYDCMGERLEPVCKTPQQAWDLPTDAGFDFKAEAKTALASPWRVLGQTTKAVATSPAVLSATDKSAPSVPGSFQATVESGNAVVNLSWDASTDSGGLKGYTLERSIDQKTWEKLADSIQATSYSDKSAGFGITYYYRLSAVDAAGNVSGYATSDATTGDFNASSGGSDECTSYTSDDSLATVLVPAGAVAEDVGCVITAVEVKGKSPGTKAEPLVAGPYALICKTAGATVVTDFLKPVTWSIDLKGKLSGVSDPKPYAYDSAKGELIKNSTYSSATNILKFDALNSSGALVLATKNRGLSLNYVAVFLLVGGAIVGVAMLVLRKKQKSTYDNYLRSKYYDL